MDSNHPDENVVNFARRRLGKRSGPPGSSRLVAVIAAAVVAGIVFLIQQLGGFEEAISSSPSSRSSVPSASPTPTTPASSANAIRPAEIRVIDGDTIIVKGLDQHVRLMGLNAPETYKASCEAERKKGEAAKARLKQLVGAGSLSLRYVDCACAPGTQGTEACNYGRACAVLRTNGRDIADILISENLAAEYRCRGSWCPPIPRNWCG